MSIELLLYLIDIFGSLKVILAILLFIILFISILFTAINYSDCDYNSSGEKKWNTNKELIVKHYWKFLLAVILCCFIPCERTMYLMLGANMIKNSELTPRVETILNKKLDEYILEEKKDNKHQ